MTNQVIAIGGSEGVIALWVSIVTAAGTVIAAIFGLSGVHRTSATTSENTLRSDLLKEREIFRDERKDLEDRIDALEEKQEDDRETIRRQATLIRAQEERIVNQNKTIRSQGQRISRLESVLRRHDIPVPSSDDTDPGGMRRPR